jgi:uncharacterized membrane protein HdeD (DUF308 family)
MLTLTKNWWVLVLRGVVAIIFAVLTFLRPGITLASLILLFGAFAFADGVLHLVAAFRSGAGNWWALLLAGIVGIGAGVVTFFYPGLTALSLLYFIAFWSIFAGIAEIIAAIRLRKEIEGEWLLGLAGLLSVVFGIFLIAAPGAGALGLLMVIAAYAFVAGIVLISLGFKLRSWGSRRLRHATA